MGNHPADEPAETTARRWPAVFSWLGVLAACVVLVEVANNPAIATAVLCVKVGLGDFKTANWLSRRDPVPERGIATWWLYVANGLTISGVVAYGVSQLVIFAGLLVLIWMGGVLGPWWDRTVSTVIGAVVPAVACVLLASVAFRMALFHAERNNISLWLNGATRRARERDTWPPSGEACGQRNLLVERVAGSTLLAGVSLCVGLLYYLINVLQLGGVWILGTALGGGILAGAVALAGMMPAKRFSATSAAECWPPDEQ
jgi:hypothetical protein